MTLQLDVLLDEFKEAMRAKFFLRRNRHARSVTDPTFDWDHELPREEIESHLREEVLEWMETDGPERTGEDVDVANLAFLDWVSRRLPR